MLLPADLPIVDSWKALALHADGCDRCQGQVQALARVPDDPRQVDAVISEQLCEAGAPLLACWWEAKATWLEATREHRARLGVIGASQEDVELRDRAWASVPDHERLRLLALPEGERFRAIEAVEAGILADIRRMHGPAAGPPRCSGCGKPFSPRRPSDRYCSRSCRVSLEQTE